MKRIALLLACAATLTAAQTTPTTTPTAKPATTPKPTTPVKPAAKPGVATTRAAVAAGPKVPANIPAYHKLVKTAFALKYQDIEVGTGPVAEPLKLYKVKYTGWLAADGKKFDSSDDHPGKEPIQFPQGRGRVIPGWDQGFEGMKIGGKRRIFIPWQMAYGAAGRAPVIPAKADLIFDVELVAVDDMPPPGMPPGRPMPPRPPTPGAPATPGSPNPGSPNPGTPNPSSPQPGGASATRPGNPATPGSTVEPKKMVVVPGGSMPSTTAPSTPPAPATPSAPPAPATPPQTPPTGQQAPPPAQPQ